MEVLSRLEPQRFLNTKAENPKQILKKKVDQVGSVKLKDKGQLIPALLQYLAQIRFSSKQ